ncbi:MAG: ATP-binding protein [Clostridia bacterium]|nr:ATP-binding protein [Clostridia bacterium]
MEHISIRIDSNINIQTLLDRFKLVLLKIAQLDMVEVNFSPCRFISVTTLTALITLLKHIQTIKPIIYLKIIEPPLESTRTYIARMDFYRILGIDHREMFIRHSEIGRFMPVRNFQLTSGSHYEIVDNTIEIIKRNCELKPELLYGLDMAFNEMLDNINEHSQSQNGGYFAVQSQHDTIEICIADSGIGIAESLRKNKQYNTLTDQECLEKAWEKGVSDGNGQGNGLYIAARLIKLNGGLLSAFSKGAGYHITPVNSSSFVLKNVYWPGTIITLSIMRQNNIDMFDLLETNDVAELPVNYTDSLDEIDGADVLW